MPSTNPTMEEFNMLTARVETLEEQGAPIPPDPPDPPDPPATSPRQKILDLFAAIKGQSWIVAQMTHRGLEDHNYSKSKGVNSAMIMTDPWCDNVGGNGYDPNAPALIAHARSGGIVGMAAALPNPLTMSGATTGLDQIDAAEMITPGTGQHNAFMALADRVANYLKPLEDAGIAYIHRVMYEADMGAFWWNVQGQFTPEQHAKLFRLYIDRLRSHGLDNMIVVWATNGNIVDHYPGDDHCDIVGWDSYTDNPARYAEHYNALKAKAPGKFIAMAEFGSGNWSTGNPNFNCQTLVDAIWNLMREVVYVMAWTGSAQGGWAWGYYQNRGVLKPPKALQWGQLSGVQMAQAPSVASLRHWVVGGDGFDVQVSMTLADRREAIDWAAWLADRIGDRERAEEAG